MAATALAVSLLAGCAGSDDTLSGLLITPGRYDIYHCDQLALSIPVAAARVRELEALKAKAKSGSAGQLVSAAVYEPDYLAARGALNEMHKAAREKHCDVSDVAPAAAPPGKAALPPPAKKPTATR